MKILPKLKFATIFARRRRKGAGGDKRKDLPPPPSPSHSVIKFASASYPPDYPPRSQSDGSISGALVEFSAEVVAQVRDMKEKFPTVHPRVLARFVLKGKDVSRSIEFFQKHLDWRETTFPRVSDFATIFYPKEPKNFPRLWLQRGGVTVDQEHVIFVQGANVRRRRPRATLLCIVFFAHRDIVSFCL